jgi:hypothetical protein
MSTLGLSWRDGWQCNPSFSTGQEGAPGAFLPVILKIKKHFQSQVQEYIFLVAH